MEFSSCMSRHELTNLRGIFSCLCLLVLLMFFVYGQDIIQNPFFHDIPFSHDRPKTGSRESYTSRSKIYVNDSDPSRTSSIENRELQSKYLLVNRNPTICSEIHQHKGFISECEYMRVNPECNSGGIINYLKFFYCNCRKFKALGYVVLVIWILVLFYLLGNTAADYFCCSLEKLSNLLNLPPTVAGVTLLPLGNGAPDVFASIAAFVGRDSGDVGLNSVLGGAVFVICIVVGIVSLCVAEQEVRIDKYCLFRDIGFFAVALVSLLVILIVGEVSVKGAFAFVSIYIAYALFVAVGEVSRKQNWKLKLESVVPLLPVTRSASSNQDSEDESVRASLIRSNSDYEHVHNLNDKIPHLMWAPKIAVFSNGILKTSDDDEGVAHSTWGWNEDNTTSEKPWFSCTNLCSYLEIPLTLPRKLTIPIIDEERWSKPYAVSSAFFAPLLLSFLWNIQEGANHITKAIIYLLGALTGAVLGILALKYTSRNHPPQRFLFPWVLGGFTMSIVWFYIIANELVSVLVAFGVILGIKPSLLALTILAWGNSMGDLMSNVAIAMSGRDGVQVAISGCYAGPMFNALIGLGVSLLVGACERNPGSYTVPRDVSLYSTVGFLMLGLIWSVVVLPRNGMRPSKLLGVGLMIIYLGFLMFRASIAMGDGSFGGLSRMLHV